MQKIVWLLFVLFAAGLGYWLYTVMPYQGWSVRIDGQWTNVAEGWEVLWHLGPLVIIAAWGGFFLGFWLCKLTEISSWAASEQAALEVWEKREALQNQRDEVAFRIQQEGIAAQENARVALDKMRTELAAADTLMAQIKAEAQQQIAQSEATSRQHVANATAAATRQQERFPQIVVLLQQLANLKIPAEMRLKLLRVVLDRSANQKTLLAELRKLPQLQEVHV